VEEVQTFFVGLNFDVMLPITAFTVLAESFSTNIEGLIEWEVGFSTCSAFKSAYHPSLSDYPHILAAYMQHFSEFFRDAHMLKDNTDLSIQVCAHLGAWHVCTIRFHARLCSQQLAVASKLAESTAFQHDLAIKAARDELQLLVDCAKAVATPPTPMKRLVRALSARSLPGSSQVLSSSTTKERSPCRGEEIEIA
jgi:hypothetical protein